jgi:ABC-2 type transport system ATP-binding protein
MSPEVLILDDPTLGLDVVARKSLFDEVISELADRGITVLMTTHDLAGVEAIADRVGILRDGHLVLDEDVETLKSRFRRIRYANQPVLLATGNLQAATVRPWGSGTEAVVSNFDDVAFERFRSSANVAEVSAMSLEEIFIAVCGEEDRVL